ncbi:hypothetical protein A6U98_14685 [Rhizobium sp. WYCCWR10014]|uniref:hypothetical protein n=1 Tax=Rhizobium sp. WYCCWR10014 TaxID=1825933 RepID=UPI0007E2E120|nr:hypothetical protein [Rhizobium sp. WYCCWR10014]OAV49889.1 hypothetical protein A6U98_14685 [Rhizobium sp. WYCCWR10014]
MLEVASIFRAPTIVRWPGKVPPGSLQNGIITGLDWFPTFVAAAGDPNIIDERKKGERPQMRQGTAGDRQGLALRPSAQMSSMENAAKDLGIQRRRLDGRRVAAIDDYLGNSA